MTRGRENPACSITETGKRADSVRMLHSHHSLETFEWHAVATLATWGMTLVIQRAEHRDTQAIHAKLDEILHALGDARNEITRMDEEEPEEIERQRKHMRKDD
jgi:hypothetical protein